MLHEQIKNNIKEAMKAGDKVRLEVVRGMLAAFTNELVTQSRKPNEMLADEEALVVIKRMIKKGSKAIPLFKQGNRQDLVDKEEAEIKILESFVK
jgi:uncharacterized protein